jgi:hypothetical protein
MVECGPTNVYNVLRWAFALKEEWIYKTGLSDGIGLIIGYVRSITLHRAQAQTQNMPIPSASLIRLRGSRLPIRLPRSHVSSEQVTSLGS